MYVASQLTQLKIHFENILETAYEIYESCSEMGRTLNCNVDQ